ncbi:MAG: hypothetical protein MJ239_01035 [Bacilli bacterium]|nr:hypothetical protein [Bacilli bacterium]
MEEIKIEVGQRLYRYFEDETYGHRRIKGEITEIKKGLFGKMKYKVLWDDKRHGTYNRAQIELWIANREFEHSHSSDEESDR